MPVDRPACPPRARVLPPHAMAGLREAFAAEVAERLPHLQAVRVGSGPDQLAAALRAAHSLGSSAAVLGEPEASRVARAVEAALLTADVAAVPDQVADLTCLLQQWW